MPPPTDEQLDRRSEAANAASVEADASTYAITQALLYVGDCLRAVQAEVEEAGQTISASMPT